MRTIKFRAWTSKQMMYQDKQYLGSFIRRAVLQINLDHEKGVIPGHESYLPNGGDIDEYFQQFTGLLDKHGKEVYEGDIVKAMLWSDDGTHTTEVIEQVEIHNGLLAPFYMRVCYEEEWWKDRLDEDGFEIIGNIYEHPQLLSRTS